MVLGLAACRAATPPEAPKPASPAPARAPGMEAQSQRAIREALLASLTPVTLSNCTFARIGSRNDGGYVMCANLMSEARAGYSYGIGGHDEWGCSISKTLKAPVHQYDCFEPPNLSCPGGTFVPHNECVWPRTETVEKRVFDTLTNQIARNGDAGKRLIVKIDVEGAEWRSLLETSDAVLDQFDQLAMELHGTNEAHFIDLIQKLKRTFHLVNIHYNNWACTSDLAPFPAGAYQVLFVNKRVGILGPAPAGQPTARDFNAPDNPNGPDCQPPVTTP
jgi:hypothetical protein